MTALVEHEVAEPERVARQLAARAAHDRLHAGHDLGQAEGLRHVVVSARTERVDLVLDRVLRGQEQDRGLVATLAEPAADLDPLDVGEHPVEDDQVRIEAGDGGERFAPRRRLLDLESLVSQSRRDGVDDRRLVVDDEDPRSLAVLALAHA